MTDPAGAHMRANPEGELATARAVASAGTIMLVSSASSYTLEEIAVSSEGPKWFQQHFYRDKALTMEMMHRAEEAGYAAICLTLDFKVNPKRERNIDSLVTRPV